MLIQCGPASADGFAAKGLFFPQPRQELGTLISGEVRELAFDFEIRGSGVIPHRFQTSCGCLNVRFVIEGKAFPLHEELPEDARGQLLIEWKTAGFLGEKPSTVQILGEGPGLPQTLKFTGTLEPWFELQPPILNFGMVDGTKDEVRTVVARGPEAFRLLDIMAGMPPLEIRAVASAQAGLEQQFEVVLPKGLGEEGEHRGFLQIRSDHQYPLTLPIQYEIAGPLWLKPGRRLLLGAIPQDVVSKSVMEVGVGQGTLPKPEVHIEGIKGAEISVVTLEDLKHYQIQVVLPSDLAAGPVAGKIIVQLQHHDEGQVHSLERVVQVLGVVTAPK